jgi:hypothetical protein
VRRIFNLNTVTILGELFSGKYFPNLQQCKHKSHYLYMDQESTLCPSKQPIFKKLAVMLYLSSITGLPKSFSTTTLLEILVFSVWLGNQYWLSYRYLHLTISIQNLFFVFSSTLKNLLLTLIL